MDGKKKEKKRDSSSHDSAAIPNPSSELNQASVTKIVT